MQDNATVQGGDDSTIPSLDEGNILEANPSASFDEAFDNAFDGILDDVEAEVPSVVEEETEEPEVSEGDEQEPSDDDSNVDTEADEDEAEEVGEERAVVDFDEMKNFEFEIGGKHYSANDLKSALGQLSKQNEAQNEVEAARKQLEDERSEFEAQKVNVQTQHTAAAGAQQLAQISNAFNDLNNQRQKAMDAGDGNKVSLISAQMDNLKSQYAQVQQGVEEAQSKQAVEAAQRLDSLGFGALNTDTQRQAAFVDYAKSNIPAGLIDVVNTNAELLALVEKARLYDKANSEVPKAKLKGAKKTLKGGAAKPPKTKSKDPLEEAFFNATSDMDFRS